MTSITRAQLTQLLTVQLSHGEIETLIFELGVDPEMLEAGMKQERIANLIDFLSVQGRLDELLSMVRQFRPNAI